MTLVEPAPAKLNLALHVRHRRPDGYHELELLFSFCRDGDRLTAEPADRLSLSIDGPFASGLAAGETNLVIRAYRAFVADVAPLPALALTLEKNLPVASGIGGGSADAAAALRLFGRIAGVPPDARAVLAVAEALGSDVPACLLGRTAVGRGRGERLVALDGVADTPVLLVNPLVPVSTAAVFARWDEVDRGPLPEDMPMAIAAAGRNDLTAPALAVAPVIAAVLAAVSATAATLVRMSGSGATCFGIYASESARDAAARAIASRHPAWWRLATSLA